MECLFCPSLRAFYFYPHAELNVFLAEQHCWYFVGVEQGYWQVQPASVGSNETWRDFHILTWNIKCVWTLHVALSRNSLPSFWKITLDCNTLNFFACQPTHNVLFYQLPQVWTVSVWIFPGINIQIFNFVLYVNFESFLERILFELFSSYLLTPSQCFDRWTLQPSSGDICWNFKLAIYLIHDMF